jgi:FkbM family methyltransferase
MPTPSTASSRSVDHGRLSASERLGHAFRTRSLRAALLAPAAAIGFRVAPAWWRAMLPWYAGRAAGTGALTLDGLTFAVPESKDRRYFEGMVWLGEYEAFERYAIARFLLPDLPVVELGGSIGVVSCLTNSRLARPEKHVVVEANPGLIAPLTANRDRNRCRFGIVNAALAYGHATVAFHVSDSSVASTLLDTTGATRAVDVEAVTFESLVKGAGFGRCALVCDIEGAEIDLVAHEAEALAAFVELFIVEVHPQLVGAQAVAALEARLRAVGFSRIWSRGTVWVLRHIAGRDRQRAQQGL